MSHEGPLSWCMARITLIHKKGDSDSPSNFHPIALASTVGKLFHRIIARRLEHYLLVNSFVDSTIQKGFLSGIDGVIEHILSLNSIINNSRTNNLPLFLTFIDLRNAFGSVHHSYIKDILSLIKLPPPVASHIANLYSHLSASVCTQQWSTPSFKISIYEYYCPTV